MPCSGLPTSTPEPVFHPRPRPAQLQPDSLSRQRFPLAPVRIYFAALRGGRQGYKAFHAWRGPADFSIMMGSTQGMDERKPLIRLGSDDDDGGRSSVGRAPGCDPGRRGFESHRPPHLPGRSVSGPLAQLVEQETLNLLVVGSTPTRPTN